MLTYNDWANTGWRFYRAIQSAGHDIEYYKCVPHRFEYPDQGEQHPSLKDKKIKKMYPIVIKATEIKSLVEKASAVYFMASTFFDTGAKLSGKTIIAQHGGYTYRNHPDKVNSFFESLSGNLINIQQSPDLMGLGAKNEHYIPFPVDTDFIRPNFKTNKILKIGHFPSNPATKGTRHIVRTMNRLHFVDNYVGKIDWEDKKSHYLKWTDNLKRMSKCDVIIEKMQFELSIRSGKKDKVLSGEWGNTAMEAAALGCIVITNSYKSGYNEGCPFLIANNQKTFETQVGHVLSMNRKEILKLKHKHREWAESHNIKSTGERLQKIFHDSNAGLQ